MVDRDQQLGRKKKECGAYSRNLDKLGTVSLLCARIAALNFDRLASAATRGSDSVARVDLNVDR